MNRPVSRLELIRKALEENQMLSDVWEHSDDFITEEGQRCVIGVEIKAVLKVTEKSDEKLNGILLSLIPGEAPKHMEPFKTWHEGQREFGYLQFEEVVGRQRVEKKTELFDRQLADDLGGFQGRDFVDGKVALALEKPIFRVTTVKLIPGKEFVKYHCIPEYKGSEMNPGRVGRCLRRLASKFP